VVASAVAGKRDLDDRICVVSESSIVALARYNRLS
jgi:hypothetical protein